MVDDIHRSDATLAILQRVDELTGVVHIGQRFSDLAHEDVREIVLGMPVSAGLTQQLVKGHPLEAQRFRDVFNDVVCTTPVGP